MTHLQNTHEMQIYENSGFIWRQQDNVSEYKYSCFHIIDVTSVQYTVHIMIHIVAYHLHI